jgi:hypothetical protein
MKKPSSFVYAASTLLGAYLLTACSSFIPPQVIPNPIGISGKKVQVEIGAAGELSTAAAGLGMIESSFSDFDTSSVPIALNLSQSLFKIAFAADTSLATSAALLPCNIFLTRVDISVTVTDALQSYTLPTFQVNKVVELEQQKDDPNSYQIITEDVFVGNTFSKEEVKKLQDVITTGGSNQVIAQVSVQATSVPELPPGSILTFTFKTSEATLTF